jgi:hypothetical protein
MPFTFIIPYSSFLIPVICTLTPTLHHRSQKLAIAICALSFAIIALEAAFFARRTLRRLSSLVFQAVKVAVVGAQWMVVWGNDNREPAMSSGEWWKAIGMSALVAALS